MAKATRTERLEAVRKLDAALACQGPACADQVAPLGLKVQVQQILGSLKFELESGPMRKEFRPLRDATLADISTTESAAEAYDGCKRGSDEQARDEWFGQRGGPGGRENIERRRAAAACGAQYNAYLDRMRALKARILEWGRHDES
ncbi:MAG: hypothetical protein M3396_01330 [Actinomycetota bacterium]|nr:hypothetical protein [Actinomycetota bacterium]